MSLDERFQQSDKQLDRLAATYERELIRNYQLALKEIRAQIAFAYEKYGSDGALSFAEMQKYGRLSNLERNISHEISRLTATSARTLKKGLGEVFAESFYRAGFLIESEVQALLGFGLLNPKTIEASVLNPLGRVGFLQRNKDNQVQLTRQLRDQLTQALLQGKSYQQAAKAIKERLDTGAANTLRIAATEMHRCMNEGKMAAMGKAETAGVIMRKKWVSAVDSRTRRSHARADGQVVGMKEPFRVDGENLQYPGDPSGSPENVINCRCSFISVIDGVSNDFRRVRGEGIVPYKTFSEYKEARINA